MTTVLAIETMLELGSSIHEARLKTGATRELVEAVFLALIGQGAMPQICLALLRPRRVWIATCASGCRGHPGSWRAPP